MKTSTLTYRFSSTLFITAVACKVSTTVVQDKTACSKSNVGSLSICWSKYVKSSGRKLDWTDILPLWMDVAEKGCV